MAKVTNPILPGFYPDPSVCRANGKFYLVHSTFAYFPGVPVFESDDLIGWKQIGNVLERDSQLPLEGCGQSEGIFAPTIRYNDGVFYMITTNISGGGNFIVTATSPEGPWSEPYFLGEEAMGIVPSLFFDTDGTCYYIGQRYKKVVTHNGDCEIWIQKLNTKTMKLEGEAVAVLDGFQKNAVWPEAPHLYKKDGYYYIIHAESGTAFHHSVMAARSRELFGPYEYCPCNPILTHRHLGKDFPVTCAGHADLVEDGNGNWYMVMLACRPQEGHTLMGRETFLAKVVWEDGWPVVNPGVGYLEEEFEIPAADGAVRFFDEDRTYTFAEQKIAPEFLSLRNHRENVMSLSARAGYLRMYMRADSVTQQAEPAYLALRQQHRDFEVEVRFEAVFGAENGKDSVGITLMQSNEDLVRAEYVKVSGKDKLLAIRRVKGKDEILLSADADGQITGLRLTVHGLKAALGYLLHDEWKTLATDVDIRTLSTESAGGFLGCTAGIYASGSGEDHGGYADLASFTYRCL